MAPHSAQSESATLDCLSAPFKSGAPPTSTHFTSLLTDPVPSPPPLPTFPDTHPLAPILPPPKQAQGGLVMQLERMFFIWTLPHTSVPVDPLVLIPPVGPQCQAVLIITRSVFFFLINYRITFLEKLTNTIATLHCQNLQVFPRVTIFCNQSSAQRWPCDLDALYCAQLSSSYPDVMFCRLRSCEVLCDFGVDVGREVNN